MDGVLHETVERKEAEALRGTTVAFTGRLAMLARSRAEELVQQHGGRCCDTVSRETTMLIVGLNGWPLRADGRVSGKLRRATRLRQAGWTIEIVREDEFLERLGLIEPGGGVCRRYTLDQVAKVAGASVSRVRGWVRAGLVAPAEVREGIEHFDFRQVSAVRKLHELTARGVTTARLRRSLQRLEAWLPDAHHWLARLELFAEGERIVARSPSGALVQPDGQTLFDFGEPISTTAEAIRFEAPAEDADELFQRALDLEERARYTEAVAAYRHWLLMFGPDAQVCFNLGNTLYSLGQHAAAAKRYRQAVEIDPDYLEAWSNLGCVLAEMDECGEAIRALERAVRIGPEYRDAIYNLADVLDRAGRRNEARVYWRAYLRFDAASPWADYARSRLGEMTNDEV
jgi:DNA-binding transcriptional MerR regulator